MLLVEEPPTRSRPVILLVANMSPEFENHGLQHKIQRLNSRLDQDPMDFFHPKIEQAVIISELKPPNEIRIT